MIGQKGMYGRGLDTAAPLLILTLVLFRTVEGTGDAMSLFLAQTMMQTHKVPFGIRQKNKDLVPL